MKTTITSKPWMGISNRRLIFYFILTIGLVWGIHVVLFGFSDTVLPRYFTYMSLACTFIPLPTIPPVLWVSREFHPVLVAFIGACGTCLANLNDYYLITYFSHWRWIRRFQENRVWRSMIRLFMMQPFLTLAFIAFIPIPVDVVRFLAISNQYNRFLYAAAYFVGRFPRYFLIAYLGYYYQPSNTIILIILAVLVILSLLKLLIIRFKRRFYADPVNIH